MADLNELLNSFLSSPENTEKLMQAMNVLKSASGSPKAETPPVSPGAGMPSFEIPPFLQDMVHNGAQNPQNAQNASAEGAAAAANSGAQFMEMISAMSSLMTAIGSLGGTPGSAQAAPPIAITPQLTSKITEAANAINNSKDDRRISLLDALRPYLSDTRMGMVDNAVKMIRFSNVSSTMMPSILPFLKGGKKP